MFLGPGGNMASAVMQLFVYYESQMCHFSSQDNVTYFVKVITFIEII